MSERKLPLRKCAACGRMKPKAELLRVVRDENGGFSADPAGKLRGRGAYICADPACAEAARKRRGLERSFKSKLPPEIYDELAEMAAKNREQQQQQQ